jgi:1-phosphatidylinositol phosphodiesterase
MEDQTPDTPENSKAVNYQPTDQAPRGLEHSHGGYSHDGEAKTSNPKWMEKIPDQIKLSELSVPGTHDTMAFYGGDAVQCQSMSLENQLESGVRVLDIRCRHIADVFAIHHGLVFQKVFFGDVLNIAIDFLKKNPSEAVLMRVKEEYEPEKNTRTFAETFRDGYWNTYKQFCWEPNSDNPTLGEIRGKIAILQNFSAAEKYGVSYGTFSIQDEYHLATNWDLYRKWEEVKAHFVLANGGGKDIKYMNYLSGSGRSFPYFVASGHSSPGTSAPRLLTGRTTPGWKNSWVDFPRVDCFIGICSIAFEGTNILSANWFENDFKNHVGVVMSDFPGPALIEATIARNNKFVS